MIVGILILMAITFLMWFMLMMFNLGKALD
jgi:hypothetical protein